MVAANGYPVQAAHAVDHFVGIGTVADYISQARQETPLALAGGEHGVQRREVRMNVTEDQKPHCRPLRAGGEL